MTTLLTQIIFGIVLFFLGASLMSFIQVLLYRAPKKMDWISDRSRCEHCGTMIAWYDNIPVISWLILQGRCRHCQTKINWIYPVGEFLMGAWVVIWWLVFAQSIEQIGGQNWLWLGLILILGGLLVLVTAIDLEKKIIPDWTIVSLLVVVGSLKALALSSGDLTWLQLSLEAVVALGATLFFWGLHYLAYRLYQRDAFGLGDVKLIAVLSFWLGWPQTVVMILGAFFSGAILGSIFAFLTKKGRQLAVPFGPFLVMGVIIAIIWTKRLWAWIF